jgi:hypothetical protein
VIRQRSLASTATIAFSVVAAGFGLATPPRAEAAAPAHRRSGHRLEPDGPAAHPYSGRSVGDRASHPKPGHDVRFDPKRCRVCSGRLPVSREPRMRRHSVGSTPGNTRASTTWPALNWAAMSRTTCSAAFFEGRSRIARIESATVVVARRGKNASARFSSVRRTRDSRRSQPGRQP